MIKKNREHDNKIKHIDQTKQHQSIERKKQADLIN